MEDKNYIVFKAARLANKFWTHNTVMVPNQKVILNEDFVDIRDILNTHDQYLHFRVYWTKKRIAGVICIPGEWNYCYIDEKFYHLVKGESNGFVKGYVNEWFYYSIMYDDWQNDWLRRPSRGEHSTFRLKGTIELTGDRALARKKINMISPIIDNVNRFTHLNGIRYSTDNFKVKTNFKVPNKPTDTFKYGNTLNSFEKQRINDLLKEWKGKIQRGELPEEPPMDRLHIPLLYKLSKATNWKWHMLNNAKRNFDVGFNVYDVTVGGLKDVEDKEAYNKTLLKKFKTDQLYTVASDENRVYTYAKSKNPTKYVTTIDLSKCTDLTMLDWNDLEPYERVSNQYLKQWSIDKLVDWVCEKQGWYGDELKERMREAFDEVCFPRFSPLLEHYDENQDGRNDLEDFKSKIFWDVGIERVWADIVDTKDPRGEVKNPEWREWITTRIKDADKHSRNFVYDGFDPGYLKIREHFTKNYDTATEEERKEAKKAIEEGKNYDRLSLATSEYYLHKDFVFVLFLTDEYKLVNNTEEKKHLDFTRTSNYTSDWFALIPDYHNKSYVPAIRGINEYQEGAFGGSKLFESEIRERGIILDYSKNTSYTDSVFCNPDDKGERCFVRPFVLKEIKKVESHDLRLEWQKAGTDFFNAWRDYGGKGSDRWKGADILSRGYAFMALVSHGPYPGKFLWDWPRDASNYTTVYMTYYSNCKSNNNNIGSTYCVSSTAELTTGPTNNDYDNWYTFGRVPAQRVQAPYTNDTNTWRDYQIEITLPLKTTYFDTLKVLREFNDIPDNFLYWEVVNTDIRKSGIKVPVNVRTMAPDDKGAPTIRLLKDDEQAKIPQNLVVSIYLCNKKINEGKPKANIDNDVFDGWKNKYGEIFSEKYPNIPKYQDPFIPDYNLRTIADRVQHLLTKLSQMFFQFLWEKNDSGNGAIPYGIDRLNDYPKHEDGRPQLGITYVKPYHGFWFIAWTRFYAPSLEYYSMQSTLKPGQSRFNPGNRAEWIMSSLPAKYSDTGDLSKYYIRRTKTTEMDSELMLSFMYNGLCPFIMKDVWLDKFHIDTNNNSAPYVRNTQERINYLREIDSRNWQFHNEREVSPPDEFIDERSYNPRYSPIFLFQKMDFHNYSGQTGWGGADKQHKEWNTYLKGKESILFKDFIRNVKTFKTRKLLNPDRLPLIVKYPWRNIEETLTASSLTYDIPVWMYQYLHPDSYFCSIHQWNTKTPNINTNSQRLQLFKEKLVELCNTTLNYLEVYPMWFKCEGTEWYFSVKLNTRSGQIHWDYEFFTDNQQLIKTKDKEKWNFNNNFREDDVDVLINSRFVLNAYGTQFQLKGKSFTKEDEVDVGLEIKAIEDEKQSIAAQWYWLHMNWGDIDVLQTIVETPKELVKYSEFSAYEREKMIRELGLMEKEFLYDQQVIDFQRTENKFLQKHEEDVNHVNWKYGVASGAMKFLGGVTDTVSGVAGVASHLIRNPIRLPKVQYGDYSTKFGHIYNPDPIAPAGIRNLNRRESWRQAFRPPSIYTVDTRPGTRGNPNWMKERFITFNAGSSHYNANRLSAWNTVQDSAHAGWGPLGMIGGILDMAKAGDTWRIENERIKAHYELAEEKLAAKGNILNTKYEVDKQNMITDIYLQSANVVRPTMNRNLVYKLYNKEQKLEDVYLTVYYPGGLLKTYLNNYYKEFGYELLEWDFECTGVEDVKRHLRYQFIYEVDHANETIKEMIKARALMGVKVVEWLQ